MPLFETAAVAPIRRLRRHRRHLRAVLRQQPAGEPAAASRPAPWRRPAPGYNHFFDEAAHGAQKDRSDSRRNVPRRQPPSRAPRRCAAPPAGTGEVRQVRQTFLGMVNVTTCPTCRGGRTITTVPHLQAGQVRTRPPPSIFRQAWTTARKSGFREGNPAPAAARQATCMSRRRATHILPAAGRRHLAQFSLNIAQATRGVVAAPCRRRNHQDVPLRGKGVPRLQHSGRGDHCRRHRHRAHLAHAEQKKLFKELSKTLTDVSPNKQKKSFFDTLSDFY